MIKAEFINRMIAIPQCIWNNFTSEDDYCRWVLYDDSRKVEERPGSRKIYEESYGCLKLGFFNYYRGNRLEMEPLENYHQPYPEQFAESLTEEEKQEIDLLVKKYTFIDYTDDEKEYIKAFLADHPVGHSLNCGNGWFGHIEKQT